METLKYPYGETPEDVIREASINAPDPTEPEWVGFTPPDDLLTVLDALAWAWETQDSGQIGDLRHVKAERAAALRISILAALGIEEG